MLIHLVTKLILAWIPKLVTFINNLPSAIFIIIVEQISTFRCLTQSSMLLLSSFDTILIVFALSTSTMACLGSFREVIELFRFINVHI